MAGRYAAAESPLSTVLREVDEAFLRPRPEAVREAKRRADRLIEELDRGRAWMYSVLNVYDHGSLSRGTGLRHFNDLDRLIELDPVALRTRGGRFRSARDTIRRMAKHIAKRRAGLISMGTISVRAQDHSVGIDYPGSGLRIDLVPALRLRGNFHIPEQGTGKWIQTDPVATTARLRQAKAAAPHAGIAIRLLKGWARARGRNAPIPSFALETWVVDQVLSRPSALDELVGAFFSEVASARANRRLGLGSSGRIEGAVTLIEPVSGNNLTKDLGRVHRTALVRSSRRAVEEVAHLQALANAGRWNTAGSTGRDLFVGRRWAR